MLRQGTTTAGKIVTPPSKVLDPEPRDPRTASASSASGIPVERSKQNPPTAAKANSAVGSDQCLEQVGPCFRGSEDPIAGILSHNSCHVGVKIHERQVPAREW